MNSAVVLAAGRSTRAGVNKIWWKYRGHPVWFHAYKMLRDHQRISEVVLVVPPGSENSFADLAPEAKIVSGGLNRMESFLRGLSHISLADHDVILEHNAANPRIRASDISSVIDAAQVVGAAAVSLPCVDAVAVAEAGFYVDCLDRRKLRLMQTPQAVRADLLRQLRFDGQPDLCSAVIPAGAVKLVETTPHNRKITFHEDLVNLPEPVVTFVGQDAHRFGTAGHLVLGGVKITDVPALEGESDGDVVLHALARALAQAAGRSFSDIAGKLYRQGIRDSRAYVQALTPGLQIRMVSIAIEAAKPRVDDLPISASVASILDLPRRSVRLEANSGNGLDACANGEGIRCTCVVTTSYVD